MLKVSRLDFGIFARAKISSKKIRRRAADLSNISAIMIAQLNYQNLIANLFVNHPVF